MLLSPRKKGLTSLFKEVRVVKVCPDAIVASLSARNSLINLVRRRLLN